MKSLQSYGPAEIAHGPLFIGLFFNVLLYGIMINQTYVYFKTFRSDRNSTKILVGCLFVLDTVNTFFDFAYLYDCLIKHFDPATTAVIATLVQLFYASRLRKLTGNIWLFISVVGLSLAGLAGGLATTVEVLLYPSFQEFIRFKHVVIVWLAAGCLADAVITAILVYHLVRLSERQWVQTDPFIQKSHKTGFQGTDVLTRTATMQTGLVTALCAIIDLILFLFDPVALHLTFNIPLCKLYTNSLLCSLNSRAQSRDSDGDSTGRTALMASTNSSLQPPMFRSSGIFVEVETVRKSDVSTATSRLAFEILLEDMSVGDSLVSGIQDISAFLPILGTEHLSSVDLRMPRDSQVVLGGFLCEHISRWFAESLANAGFNLEGSAAVMIGKMPKTDLKGRDEQKVPFKAASDFLDLLKEQYADNRLKPSLNFHWRRWAIYLLAATTFLSIFSLAPYAVILKETPGSPKSNLGMTIATSNARVKDWHAFMKTELFIHIHNHSQLLMNRISGQNPLDKLELSWTLRRKPAPLPVASVAAAISVAAAVPITPRTQTISPHKLTKHEMNYKSLFSRYRQKISVCESWCTYIADLMRVLADEIRLNIAQDNSKWEELAPMCVSMEQVATLESEALELHLREMRPLFESALVSPAVRDIFGPRGFATIRSSYPPSARASAEAGDVWSKRPQQMFEFLEDYGVAMPANVSGQTMTDELRLRLRGPPYHPKVNSPDIYIGSFWSLLQREIRRMIRSVDRVWGPAPMDTETPGYTFPVDGVVQAEYAMYPKLAGDEPVLWPSVDAAHFRGNHRSCPRASLEGLTDVPGLSLLDCPDSWQHNICDLMKENENIPIFSVAFKNIRSAVAEHLIQRNRLAWGGKWHTYDVKSVLCFQGAFKPGGHAMIACSEATALVMVYSGSKRF
ncbi:hypothetical protein C8J57DRAFT_1527474 [Mycena rebaudengoi]|nr:hypothetical protein C8J57DRAFT_1527474 [Mycena rebaudengoi]